MNSEKPAALSNHLLVIDDEIGVTSIIEHIARAQGFEVLSIHDSEQFEKAFAKIRPSIIFLDIAMPGRDGMQLLGHLAATGYSGQIIIMSGSDNRYIQMSAAIAKTRGLAVAGTLSKPFRKQQVLDLLLSTAIRPLD